MKESQCEGYLVMVRKGDRGNASHSFVCMNSGPTTTLTVDSEITYVVEFHDITLSGSNSCTS